MSEEVKKRPTGSGSNFFCTVCEIPDISSMAGVKEHYKETQHAVVISTWFTSIWGTEEDYTNETESKYDI